MERLDEAINEYHAGLVDIRQQAPDDEDAYARMDTLLSAARAYRDLLAAGAEPDYGAAFAELVSRHRCSIGLTATTPFSIYDVRSIVDAAVAGRLLVDPPKEEGT